MAPFFILEIRIVSFLTNNKGFSLGLFFALTILLLPSTRRSLSVEAQRTAALFLIDGCMVGNRSCACCCNRLSTFSFISTSWNSRHTRCSKPLCKQDNIFILWRVFNCYGYPESGTLHKRIALFVLENAGSNGASLIFGFMLTAAVISMWVMNTATTIMLLPIGLAVVSVVKTTVNYLSEEDIESFQLALLLGIAYGATIGGMSTLIGTGPNGMLAAFMADNYDLDISFVDWMKVGVPLSAVMLPCSWFILTKVIFKVNFETSSETRELLSTMKSELGELKGPELKVLIVFLLTALAWMFRTVLDNYSLLSGLSDAGIAMISALFLFLLPSGNKEKKGALLEWQDAQENVPWGLLVLFGGGLSLANAVQSTGLAVWIGSLIPQGISLVLIVILVVILIIFLTELTSNMATTATFLPVVAAIAIQSDFDPILVTAAVALAASCAFMLPVATPPNAIVFGSGLIRVPQMARAGFLINVLGIIIVSFVAVVSVPYFLL